MAVQTRRLAHPASLPRFNLSLSYRLLIIIVAWVLGATATFAYLGDYLPISLRAPHSQESLVGIPPDCRDGTCECGDGICTPTSGESATTCAADCIGSSVCGNNACEPGEDATSCAVDCDPASGGDTCNEDGICGSWEDATCIDCQGWPASCGDHICKGETSSTCPVDCMVCGNNTCEPLFGEDISTCPYDCTSTTTCGDATCDPTEDAISCPADCAGGPTCGDSSCDAGETVSSCPADCNTTVPTDEPTSEPTASTRTTTYCGDNVCNGDENVGWCPADCTPDPVCGDKVCNGDETAASCAVDCSKPPVCGDKICDANQGETRTTCATDCGVTTVAPTRTPSPTPTDAPTEAPSQTDEPATEIVEVAEVTTDEPPTDPPPTDPVMPPAENTDLTEHELEFVEAYTLDYLPTSCRLLSIDDASNEAASGLNDFAADLLVFADRVLVCEGAPSTICVPAAEDAESAKDVQIISCNDAGTCKVYQSTELGKVAGETIACVESRLGRPMPKCDGACATATGIKVTETDVSGYVIPFGIVMTILMIGGVWFTFVFSRAKNREIIEEIDGMDDENLVSKS